MTTATREPQATVKQVKFINDLLAERPNYQYRDALKGLIDTGRLTVSRASKAIEHLLSTPAEKTEHPVKVALSATNLPEKGIYTVVMGSERRTLKFTRAHEGFFAGKVIVSFLNGPSNTGDYAGFAHIDGVVVKVWSRYTGATELKRALELLAGSSDAQTEAGLAYSLESGNCYRCGRLLTVPESIERGLGPDCAQAV